MKPENIHKDGKLAAIIAHITPLGLIIAYFINHESKDPFGKFYLNQTFGIYCVFLLLGALIGFIPSPYAAYGFYLFIFILWLYSFMGAIALEYREVPFIGRFIQKLLK